MFRTAKKHLRLALVSWLITSAVTLADSPAANDEKAQSATRLAFLKQKFDFQPIPQEGGYYFSTYRSTIQLPGSPPRPAGSAIYFLMGPGDFSALHRLKADEIYHYYSGSPIALLQLFPDGTGRVTICGPEFWKDQQPQVLVRRGTWQGSHPLQPDRYSLLGTTMTPGFIPEDFELGKRAALLQAYPKFATEIKALTRP